VFVARLLTVVTPLRQQQRDVLDDLTGACAAVVMGAPSRRCCPRPLRRCSSRRCRSPRRPVSHLSDYSISK